MSTLLRAAKRLKGLSHLPQLLLWLDRARVHFPPLVRFVGAGVNAAITLGCKCTKTSMRRSFLYAFKQTVERVYLQWESGSTAIRPDRWKNCAFFFFFGLSQQHQWLAVCCLFLLSSVYFPAVSLEFSLVLIPTNQGALSEICSKTRLANEWWECCCIWLGRIGPRANCGAWKGAKTAERYNNDTNNRRKSTILVLLKGIC